MELGATTQVHQPQLLPLQLPPYLQLLLLLPPLQLLPQPLKPLYFLDNKYFWNPKSFFTHNSFE